MNTTQSDTRNKITILYIFISVLALLAILSIDIWMFITDNDCLVQPTGEFKMTVFIWMVVCVILGGTYCILNIAICIQMIRGRTERQRIRTRAIYIVVYLAWTIVGGFVTWYYRQHTGHCGSTTMWMYLHILVNMIFILLQTHIISRQHE